MSDATKTMIRGWLEMHKGDREGLAKWMRIAIPGMGLKAAREAIAEALAQ